MLSILLLLGHPQSHLVVNVRNGPAAVGARIRGMEAIRATLLERQQQVNYHQASQDFHTSC